MTLSLQLWKNQQQIAICAGTFTLTVQNCVFPSNYVTFLGHGTAEPPVAPADQISPQHVKEQQQQRYAHLERNYPADNVDVAKTPILAG